MQELLKNCSEYITPTYSIKSNSPNFIFSSEADSSLMNLLQIGRLNIWEWHLATGDALDFGYFDSILDLMGEPEKGSVNDFYLKVHPDDREYVMQHLKYVLYSEVYCEYHAEYRIQMTNGHYEWIQARGKVLRDNEGRPEKMLGVWFNDNERQNLHQKQSAAAKAARASSLGELASQLAHELSQPLLASSAYLDGCLQRLENNQVNQADLIKVLNKANEQIAYAGKIIHKIRNFICRGDMAMEKTSLRKILDQAIEMLKPNESRRIRIHVFEDVPLPEVDVDRTQIKQVFLNLLSNSYDALQESQNCDAKIIVSLHQQDQYINVHIQDNGAGIPSGMINHLFDPFYSTKSTGMGMGLAICRSIIEAHGGRIKGRSVPEGGAIFSFSLPVV